MHLNNTIAIPSHDLMHNNQKVSFAFRTMEEIHERNGNVPDSPHRHDYYTVLWAKNVCGQHIIDYQEFAIMPNYVFFVSPGQVHQVITFGKPEGVVIMFTFEFLQQNHISTDFISDLGLFSCTSTTPPLLLNKQGSLALSQIVETMQEAFNGQTQYRTEVLGAYLKLFLIECNKYAPGPGTDNTQSIQAGRSILKRFRRSVEKNFRKWHKVSDYAGSLNITSDYLNNVIKTAIGKTAKDFIQERIILEAKRLGIHTNLTNKEIAYQLGFDDPSHFSKFYKNIDKKAFSDFRTMLEKNPGQFPL
ncbi:MAG: helix-turn-helix domain-containing protein [Bacteroidales bacterium]|nr:helix-turn-helix domain-containing protein [Bacteroidales bacterium]